MKVKRVNLCSNESQNILLTLQQLCLPYDRPYKTNSGFWWIVVDEANVPVAFAGLVPSVSWADVGYLCRAGVVASNRGQGLQKRLIRVRIAQAKKNKWNWLVTDTFDNPASSNSLMSLGFRLFDPTNPWGAKGTLYWRLKLKG